MQSALRIIRFAPGDWDDEPPHSDWPLGPTPAELEDLPYRVEVWDQTASYPEVLVAVTVSASLAYAAYYAAAREFFGRDVTLTHKGSPLAHWRTRRN